MRTITVPKKYGYPTLDITVNGKEYTVKSGEEIEVEDHIAEAIENAIALAPQLGVPRNKIAQLAEDSLTEITAEDLEGITLLGSCAFYSCLNLRKVTIPNGITKIDSNAFGFSAKLGSVYLPEVPPALTNINAFEHIKSDCVFYCKTQASLDAYKTATNWSTLTGTYTFVVK